MSGPQVMVQSDDVGDGQRTVTINLDDVLRDIMLAVIAAGFTDVERHEATIVVKTSRLDATGIFDGIVPKLVYPPT